MNQICKRNSSGTWFRKHYAILLAAMFVAALLLGACDVLSGAKGEPTPVVQPVSQSAGNVIVEGHIVPRENTDLFFTTAGKVDEVLVKQGDQVSKGQVLARLGDREPYQAQVTASELELTSAQQAYDDLTKKAGLAYGQAWMDVTNAENAYLDAQERLAKIDTDDYQDKIDDAKQTVADAESELKDAQDEFDKYADLDVNNTNRKNAENALTDAQDKYDKAVRERDRLVNDLDQARAEVELAKSQLEDAQRRRDARKDGPDPDELALAKARLDNANAQFAAAQSALTNLDLTAPYDGAIVKVDITAGEMALPNRIVMVIADFSQLYVETSDLTENEVISIKVGQSAIIAPDALPDLELNGKVERIADTYVEKSGDITYLVRVLLTDIDPRLRWGMTVEVRFGETP
jgi:multidrug resistance efflux pump